MSELVGNLWLAFQFLVLLSLVVAIPTGLILGLMYAIDAVTIGRWQRQIRSPKRRRRLNGTIVANHIGKRY